MKSDPCSKSRSSSTEPTFYRCALIALLTLNFTLALRAQVVADGATNTLSNVTNLFTSDVTVGTNGSFTLLVLSDNTLLTNSANVIIGRNTTAKSNEVHLISPSARWLMGGLFAFPTVYLGSNGASSRLVISNGAAMVNSFAYISSQISASNNQALVTGPGSLWRMGSLFVGAGGAGNQMLVSDGAVLDCASSVLGTFPDSSNNLAVVTGPGSTWTNQNYFTLGLYSVGNQLRVSNGATMRSHSTFLGNQVSASNNLLLVTGPGTVWSNTSELRIGEVAPANRLILSNSALVSANGTIYLGYSNTSTGNRLMVEGGTLRVTNASGNGLLDIRRGTNVFNAGLIEADIVRMTNAPQSVLQFNGGTLSARSSRISSGTILRIGNGTSSAGLFLAGNGVHDFSGNLFVGVSSNAVLTGNGTVLGGFTISPGGALIPGASIGKIAFTNSPALQGSVLMEISKNGFVVTNDQVDVAGALTYGGALVVTNLGPSGLAAGDRFKIFNAASYANSFALLTLPPLPPRLTWTNKLLVDGSIEVFTPPAIPLSSGSYVQDFNTLPTNNLVPWRDNSTLLGWYASASNLPAPFTVCVASDGFDNSGNLYSYGSAGSSDRALAALPDNAIGDTAFGLCFTNDLSVGVSNFAVAYTGEQWRNGGSSSNTLTFWYRVSPTTLTNPEPGLFTGWTQVTALNFLSPTLITPNGSALDGNATSNRQAFAPVPIPGLVVPPAHNVFFRWHETNDSGADQGLGVEDVLVSFSPLPAERFWTNAFGGDYDVAENWLDSLVPTPRDNANFTNNGSYQVTWPADASAANAFFQSLGGTVTQSIVSASWTVTNNYVVDSGSSSFQAVVTHPSGVLRVTNAAGTARLVVGGTGFGTYILEGGEIIADQFIMTNGNFGQFAFRSGVLRARHIAVNPTSGLFIGDNTLPATLELLGNGTHQVGSFFTISSNATLEGNGTIIGGVQVDGTLSPGTSVGQMSVQGVLAFGLGSRNVFEINKAAGTNDNIIGLSNVFYHGTLVVTNLGGTPAVGDKFRLFSAAAYSHSGFSSLLLPPLVPGLKWENNLIADGSLQVVTNPVRDFGIDVSHFQNESGVPQANWDQLFAEGRRFVFVKATEGLTGPNDPAMAINVSRALAAGLLVGVYHHSHPENRPTTDGAIAEAINFLTYAGSAVGPGRLRPVITVEFAAGNLSTTALTDWVIAFSNEIIAQRGSNAAPIIYCDQIFANFEFDNRLATYDLWLRTVGTGADSGIDDPPSQLGLFPTGVFNDWAFWQYSGDGSAGGISPLDLDVCHSEHKSLGSFLIPGPPPGPIGLTGTTVSFDGSVQFSFTNTPGALFTVLSTTNLSTPTSNWTVLAPAVETSPGQFQFSDPQATNNPERFYRVRSP